MLKNIDNIFDINTYKLNIRNSEIEKVSFFLKKDMDKLKNKRIFFLDLEFSQNRVIFEEGGFIYDNGKIVDHIYNEYSLPRDEKVWNFDLNKYTSGAYINEGKPLFTKESFENLMKIIDSVDYVVIHNYVAELTCFHKLMFTNRKYDKNDIPFFKEGKVICTNYTFNNKYFKANGMIKFNNSEVSKYLGWEVIDSVDSIYFENKSINIQFKIKKPIEVSGKLHNSYYDSAVTLTNFYSLVYLSKDK